MFFSNDGRGEVLHRGANQRKDVPTHRGECLHALIELAHPPFQAPVKDLVIDFQPEAAGKLFILDPVQGQVLSGTAANKLREALFLRL